MSGHGHVTPNPDGSIARCGGPPLCAECALELAALGQPDRVHTSGYVQVDVAGVPHRCPVCLGAGVVSRPPGVPADQQSWPETSAGPWPCRPCGGSGIVWAYGGGR